MISLEDEKSARTYFEGFQNELRSHRIIVLAEHKGSDPKTVVLSAKKEKMNRDKLVERGEEDPFDEVWVVFDTEGPQNSVRNLAARNAIDQARQLNFKTAVSNPSFEFWLLLHFEYSVESFETGDKLLSKLKTHLSYDKGQSCYDSVRELTEGAVRHAERLINERYEEDFHPCGCHPCTQVHLLIKSILQAG